MFKISQLYDICHTAIYALNTAQSRYSINIIKRVKLLTLIHFQPSLPPSDKLRNHIIANLILLCTFTFTTLI